MNLRIAFSALIATSMLIISCAGPQGERAATGEAKTVADASGLVYEADLSASQIEWIGTKPGGQHNGTISVNRGHVKVDNATIVGGEMIIDMNSIVVLDLTDPDLNARLRGHLLSADFFETETYPEAVFVFTDVVPYAGEQTGSFEFTHLVSGNLTMKEVTRNVTFPAMIDLQDNAMKAVTDNFIIDRSEWNVRFGSRKFFDNLLENYIHDDISLKIMFVANR